MRAKTGMTGALIRFRYGKGYRYLTSVPVPTSSGSIHVQIFDTSGQGRVYAWEHPADGRIVIIEHRGAISSPHAAVSSATRISEGTRTEAANGGGASLDARRFIHRG